MEKFQSKSCSLKVEGKPMLFSFDLESEFKYIEKKVFDSRRYSQRNLEKEEKILKKLAIDFMNIIQTKVLTEEELNHLECAITEGPGGIWETAVSQLGLLAYHFDAAKDRIKSLIRHSNSKVIIRSLHMLSNAFTQEEQMKLLKEVLNHKSKKVRSWASNTALSLRSPEFIAILEDRKLIESDKDVLDSLNFSIENMHQPKI
ncbi:MAG: HEAT repeat domain-containing protein [Alphaproteobacteria bacterium]|nr:HEAT repeat domain-containing protein [Alphaproteobacteria bacterium]